MHISKFPNRNPVHVYNWFRRGIMKRPVLLEEACKISTFYKADFWEKSLPFQGPQQLLECRSPRVHRHHRMTGSVRWRTVGRRHCSFRWRDGTPRSSCMIFFVVFQRKLAQYIKSFKLSIYISFSIKVSPEIVITDLLLKKLTSKAFYNFRNFNPLICYVVREHQ